MIWMPGNQLVLLYASQSLVMQAAEWARRHQRYQLRLSETCAPVEIERVMCHSTAVVIDATDQPERALEALSIGVETVGRNRLAVYTGRTDTDLETFVALHAVTLLTGPMSAVEWSSALDVLRQAPIPEPTAAGY